jgi:large subunit ribosomal protein L24
MNLIRLICFNSSRVKPNKKLQVPFKRWNIVKGDQVIVRSGRSKGTVGKVLTVYRKANKVKVDGVNIKIKQSMTEEGIKQKSKNFPLHVSKVSLIDPEKKVATRISYGFMKDTGEKVRISKKSGVVIPKPPRDDLKR